MARRGSESPFVVVGTGLAIARGYSILPDRSSVNMRKKANNYDPLRVLTDAAKIRDAGDQTVNKARDFELEWRRARGFSTATTEALIGFADILRVKDGAFWLDYVACELGCRKRVSDDGLRPSVSNDPQFAAEFVALRILLLAVAGDAIAVGRELDVVTHANQLGCVSEAVRALCDRLEPWCFGREEPLSPWITATELSRACRGRLKGLSRANVSKGINGQLLWKETLGQRNKYRLFQHATQHREMLSNIVAELKKSKFLSFIFPGQEA